jgi:predicted lactoylglutathione lyase
MTNETGTRFAMVALYVQDLQRSVDFYRLIGLDLPDPRPDSPVVIYREGNERRMIIATDDVARRFDEHRVDQADRGYRQVVEFFVDGDAEVDAAWQRITGAGFEGISAPGTPNGAYTTLVRDPDDNVVMLTHEP